MTLRDSHEFCKRAKICWMRVIHQTKVKILPVCHIKETTYRKTYYDFSKILFSSLLSFFFFYYLVHHAIGEKSTLPQLSPVKSYRHRHQSSRVCVAQYGATGTARWHGLIYIVVWVHGYFLHGRGSLHAGRLCLP